MLTDPEHCEHERRQAVASTQPQSLDIGPGHKIMQIPVVFVVCLDCGKAEEASL